MIDANIIMDLEF